MPSRIETADGQITIDTEVLADYANPTVSEIGTILKQTGEVIPFSLYMDRCLYGISGFYSAAKAKIEGDHDFTTAPEASPVFGAMAGKTLVRVWEAMGKPDTFQAVEMGAGKGSLAYALLYWTREMYPQFYQALQYTIVEYAPHFIDIQNSVLAPFGNKVHLSHASVLELPLTSISGAFISNELPDAFPVNVVKRIDGVVKQKFIGIRDNRWIEVWQNPSLEVANFIREFAIEVKEDTEEPINLQMIRFQKNVDSALKKGVIITYDYGHKKETGFERQPAIRCMGRDAQGHKISKEDSLGPYRNPGNVDMTASINYQPLSRTAVLDGLNEVYLGTQRELFRQIGIAGIISHIHQKAAATRSWKEYLRLVRIYRGYQDTRSNFDNFLVQILAKDLSVNMADLKDREHPKTLFMPLFSFHPDLHRVDFPRIYYVAKPLAHLPVETDNRGCISISPADLGVVKIYDSANRLVCDTTDAAVLERLRVDAGYDS